MKFRFISGFPFLLQIGFLLAACTSGGTGTTNKPTPYPTYDLDQLVSTLEVTPPASASDLYPVIIDTDMATDDWMAILFLLHRPEVDVQAITVTGTGEAHCDPGVSNALGLIALADHSPVAVACGRETPLLGDHVFPQAWRDFVDGMAGMTLPGGENPISGLNAVQLLIQTIQSSPVKVTLLALGPLTNVAEALQSEPALTDNIRMIYIMGGAVTVPGNLGVEVEENTKAEWNIYIDPHAANVVFSSGVSVTLVGLDATSQAPVTMDFFQRLGSAQDTPSAVFAYELLSRMQDFIQSGTYYFWDPLAAGIMVDEDLASVLDFHLCVLEDEGPEVGRTVTLDGCPSVWVAVSADGSRFEQVFIDGLNSLPVP
jgi:inosine-uridine nucleoside N-ribohydrolase